MKEAQQIAIVICNYFNYSLKIRVVIIKYTINNHILIEFVLSKYYYQHNCEVERRVNNFERNNQEIFFCQDQIQHQQVHIKQQLCQYIQQQIDEVLLSKS